MKRPTNATIMLGLWLFAFLLAGLVVWLMILRGPAVMP